MPTAVEYYVGLALTVHEIENGQPVPRSQIQELVQGAANIFGTGSVVYQDLQQIPLPSAHSPVWESSAWEAKHIVPEIQAALVGVALTPDHTLSG
jgi:hypothetical protein